MSKNGIKPCFLVVLDLFFITIRLMIRLSFERPLGVPIGKKEHKQIFSGCFGPFIFTNWCLIYIKIWLDIGPYTPPTGGCLCTFLGLFGGAQRAPKWPKTAYKTFF
jgi:hypothetical protein